MAKTALITGASSGIGRCLAKLFARDGYNLVLVGRRKERLDELAAELCGQYSITTSVIAKDLSSPSSPTEIFDELRGKSIHIDILVNYAAIAVHGEFHKTGLEQELQMIQINLVSLTYLTKLAVTEMLKQGGGKILNLASVASFFPVPLGAVYFATKAYVLSFSDAIAKDLEGAGITVTTLCPGPTATEGARKYHFDDTRLFSAGVMNAERVAEIGYRALMRGKRTVVAGVSNKLLMTMTRITPRGMILILCRFLMGKSSRTL